MDRLICGDVGFGKTEVALRAAFVVGMWALSDMPTPSLLDLIMAIILLFCGMASMYGMWLMAISTSFFFVRVDNLRFLLWTAADTGRWPVQVFQGWLRWILLTVIPMGAMTTLPAMALRGNCSLEYFLLGITVAIGFLMLSRIAWLFSLRHYSSASS